MKDKEYLIWASKAHLLNEEQVADLIIKLKLGGKHVQIEGTEYTASEDWLLPGIENALKMNHLLSNSSLIALRRSKGFKQYRSHLEQINEELVNKLGPRVKKHVLAHHVGIALVSYCKRRMKKHISASRVLSMVDHSIEALEEAFPGYLRSGLFNHILNVTEDGRIEFDGDE